MKKSENILGFIIIILILVVGKSQLQSEQLFFRLIIGAGLGYALTRSFAGFAGSVNRAINTGSTKLMRTLMFMFFISAVLTAGLLFGKDPTTFGLWIKPISLGVIVGGIFFGFGMTFSVCCASGVLQDLTAGFPRAFVTLIFFMMGVFLGFPVQKTASWVNDSWITSPIGEQFQKGVFLPDWFKGDGLEGYLGALALLGVFCLIVVGLSYLYEKKRKDAGTYTGVPAEKMQESVKPIDLANFKLFSKESYDYLFANPWTMKQGVVVISLLFLVLMGVTGSGWGASQPYGIWFGKILMIFGFTSESLSEFTKMSAAMFERPFFQDQISVQNFGILLGTTIYMLTAGILKETFLSEITFKPKDIALYSLGGLTMGLGTRFANGCNVGALYTPIANFSLSGWLFLVAMVAGGILGSKFNKVVNN
ncbi:MAG: YeeE/YedE family protein [Eubacteriales bacterium]